jgi:hypothetical protein
MAESGPWDSGITQQFIEPLVDNLIAVLQAGEASVHAEVNGGVAMTPYRSWRCSKWAWLVQEGTSVYPACSVIPRRTKTHKGEDGRSVDEGHLLEILIETVGKNPDDLARSVTRRVKAAHIIIERAALADLFDGFLPSKSHRPYWDIDHDYASFMDDGKTTYKQNGSLIITFTGLMEKT